jgi:ABC-2 type transport system ATP-binding protein
MNQPVIETSLLTKSYGRVDAVQRLSLHVPEGSICGFLGKNGSGKSTTFKMLLGMTWPTSGDAWVFGQSIRDARASVEVRRRIGFVSEDKRLYHYMTVSQMIRFTRAFFPGWREDLERRLAGQFRLPLDRKTSDLSKGMRTKLALLLALCRGAEVLILDEPTEGLDPVATEEVLQLLTKMASDGVTIFFSSHQIGEVEQIADRIAIINNGELVIEEDLDALKDRCRRIRLLFEEDVPAAELEVAGVVAAQADGRAVSLLASSNVEQIVGLAHSMQPLSVEVCEVSLKEIFLECAREN